MLICFGDIAVRTVDSVCQLCVTLWDWDHIAERFEKSTHYLEKALYKRLTEEIVPMVTAEMRARLIPSLSNISTHP